jgi:hypothetical protein
MEHYLEIFEDDRFSAPTSDLDYTSIESDYDDLLTVEMAIKKLHGFGLLNDRQVEIIRLVANGMNFNQVASAMGLHRQTVAENFITSCRIISDYLDDYFTVDGYINYLSNKHRFTNKDREKARDYIEKQNYTKYWRNNEKT